MMESNAGHPGIETLSAWLDGELDAGAGATASLERHVAACATCGARVSRLRSLVAAAGSLPREAAPPPAAWVGVRRRLADARQERAKAARRRWWTTGVAAAAAAAATLVLWVGANVLPPGPARAKARPPSATPAAVLAVDRSYGPTLAELRATFETRRHQLAPATVRTLERSLAVIDSAIAEARAALAADPASPALRDLLTGHYAHKVEFLKRAAHLSFTL